MPTTILQATVGAGKTEAALERLSQTIHDPQRPFAKAWVLLATKRQEVAFRQRLSDLPDGRAVYFNAEFFNFYQLNARLLNLAGIPPRRIKDSARLGLLRQLLRDLLQEGALQVFAPIATSAGFVGVMADLVYELKQNRVDPDRYRAAAQTQKDRELALIYTRYQQSLIRHDLVDLEGEGWLALKAAQEQRDFVRDVDLLLVDGYDQFTPVQAELLAWLSLQVREVVITLTKAPGDRDDDAQATIGRRFIEAARRLQAAHASVGALLHVQEQPEPRVPKAQDLLTLGRNIFSNEPPIPAQGAIRLLEAPEPQQEAAAVLREVKRLLLEGTRPDDILIALRDWPRYHTFFDLYERLYELPLLLHYGEPLANNPAVVVLLNTLALAGDDPDAITSFRRRELLDVLRSPYVNAPGLDAEAVDLLERISREKQVVGGRKSWLDAIKEAADDYHDEDGEPVPPMISVQQEAELSTALEAFLDGVTAVPENTLEGYVSWLENLIGPDPLQDPDDDETLEMPNAPYTLAMPECIRAVSEQATMERILNRDTQAMNRFKELLGGMLETQEFLRTTLGQASPTRYWQDFHTELLSIVKQSVPDKRSPVRSGRVLVTTATEARGLPHPHVFILGLSEGIFPAELPEDPIYLDSERAALQDHGVLLETVAERTDDNGIFYELISLPRQSLTLSRPTVQDGKPWVESHLWRMTKNVFEQLPLLRYGIGDVVPAEEVSAIDEALLVLAQGLSQPQPDDATLAIYQWVLGQETHAAHWKHIQQGRDVEIARLSRQAHSPYSGQLQHPDLLEVVAEDLSPQRVWSASQLNEYGLCPYRFFAKRFLKLESLEEPQEGLDALQLGLLNHAILEETYRSVRDDDLWVVPEDYEDALEILQEVAHKAFREAPQKYQFRAEALWQQQQTVLLRRLQELLTLDFSPDSPLNKLSTGPRRPFYMEQKFGYDGKPTVRLAINDEESIRVRGSIDRIDRAGDRLILVDYKSGSTRISLREMQEGRNFQMLVYLLALEQIIAQENWSYDIAGGLFWHIRNQAASGTVTLDDGMRVVDLPEAQDALRHLNHNVQQARRGNFTVQPTKIVDGRCASYCDYTQLCRLANTNQFKTGR